MLVSPHTHIESALSASPIQGFIKKAKELGRTHLAVTDHNMLASFMTAYAAIKKHGLKMCPGVEVYFKDPSCLLTGSGAMAKAKYYKITLFATTQNQFNELSKLCSKVRENRVYLNEENFDLWNWDDLKRAGEAGLVCVGSDLNGLIEKPIVLKKAGVTVEVVKKLKELFPGRLYLTIVGVKNDKFYSSFVQVNYKDGTTDLIPANSTVQTNAARKIQVSDLIDSNRHFKIKSKLVNNIFYVVDKDIKEVHPIKAFAPFGYDLQKNVNIAINKISEILNVPMLYSDYAYYAEPKHKLVQDVKMTSENRREYATRHMQSREEALEYLKSIGLENKTEQILSNNNKFAELFNNFEFKNNLQLPSYDGDINRHITGLIKQEGRMKWDDPVYLERLKKEINVLANNGVLNFLPYFLPIRDVVKYYYDQGVLTGPGRGCLTGDTLVCTEDGYCELEKITKGTKVLTHTGQYKSVIDTMKFEVSNSEKLLRIKTQFSLHPSTMTKDHKVYAVVRQKAGRNWRKKVWDDFDELKIRWVRADELKVGDLLYVPHISTVLKSQVPNIVDLAPFSETYDNSSVYVKTFEYSDLSTKKLAKKIGVSSSSIKKIKLRKNSKYTELVREHLLHNYSLSLEDWQQISLNQKRTINRYLHLTDEVLELIGRWVGDGWLRSNGNEWGICFNKNEIEDIEKTKNLLTYLGFKINVKKHNTKALVQIRVKSTLLVKLFKHWFPDYQNNSRTKSLSIFKTLSLQKRAAFLRGLWGADGSVKYDYNAKKEKRNHSIHCIDTTSKTMVLELRKFLLEMGIRSSVQTRKSYLHPSNPNWKCNFSYKILFQPPWGLAPINNKFDVKTGFLSPIINIGECEPQTVYDISVDEDFSYVTSDYTVHNSAAGSLLAYLLGITHIDPIQYNLSFERFQTLERLRLLDCPDIDQDLPSRDLLVGKDGKSGYLFERYGNKAAQISNRSMLRLKSSIKDVNRCFNKGRVSKEIEKLTKALPSAPQGVSDAEFVFGFEDSDGNHHPGLIEYNDDLKQYAKNYPEEWEVVQLCLGVSRQIGKHASAFVISDNPIGELAPTFDTVFTQWEMKGVQTAGLIKYDFLVVKQLEDIQLAIELINKKHGALDKKAGYFDHNGVEMFVWDLPEDKKVYESIWEGDTVTIFQLHTQSMVPFVKKIRPKNLQDISDILALVRPGPLDFVDETTGRNMAEEYIERRYGRSKADIPEMQKLLPETYGVQVYQENTTLVAKEIGGMSAEDSEKLRRLFSKKQKAEAMKMKPVFMEGAIKNVGKEKAEKIWAQMETSSRYSFNKSHSLSYSAISYACMFLKYYYPLEWWTAVLSNAEEEEITTVLFKHVKDIYAAPDINLSTDRMIVDYANNKIRAKLTVLKGLGDSAVAPIIANRPYTDIKDFVDKEVAGPSLTKKLIHAGVMDSLFPVGSTLMQKMQAYEDAKEEVVFERKIKAGKKPRPLKKGTIDPTYIGMHPIRDFCEKKKILPTMPASLTGLMSTFSNHCHKTGEGTDVVLDDLGRSYRLISGQDFEKIEPLVPEKNIYFAMAGYVLKAKEFDYQGGAKKALKVNIDCDGFITEQVLWPDYNSGELQYPKEFEEGVIAVFFFKKREGKPGCSIQSIIVEEKSLT